MDENIVLDTSKEKQFVKSIKGIKNLIKKNDGELKTKEPSKIKTGKVRKHKRKERGLVYLSHIPHGFYEHEMTQYFKQFGVVTNCRVIRSKRTGKSKGFAFVEFKETSVAQIVAETMNNYLMGKRLIKAGYIPPEEQKRKSMRKHWNSLYNPGNLLRQKIKKAYNNTKGDAGELKRARKLISNFLRTKKKLADLGIDYDFFTPVDVPEVLMERLVKKENENEDNIQKAEKIKHVEKKPQKEMKKKNVKPVDFVKIEHLQAENIKDVEKKPQKEMKKKNVKPVDFVKIEHLQAEKIKDVEKKPQKEIKKKNVKPIEDFVKIEQSDSESDSPYEFDSDDYENVINNDSLEDSDDENDSKDEMDHIYVRSEASDDDALEIIKREKIQPKKRKVAQIIPPIESKKQLKSKRTRVEQNMKKTLPVPPVKGAFEKQKSKKARGKQFKKK